MNARNRLRSLLLNVIFSPRLRTTKRWFFEKRRRLSGQPHVVSVFLQIDDPYSYLLSYYLPSLVSHYDIELRCYLSEASVAEYQPAPQLLAEYAILDCKRLAQELGVPFLDKGDLPPTEHRVGLTNTVAAAANSEQFTEELLQALAVFWRGDIEGAARRSSVANEVAVGERVIAASGDQQKRLGHYNSAMLNYGGEWYWGVDRLQYLLDRLRELGAAPAEAVNPQLASIKQIMQVVLPVTPPQAASDFPPLELFYSIRSPYSYLSLQRTYKIADAFGVQLKLRPVFPMVMRGMKVPRLKMRYIVMDSVREAQRSNIPFGKLADPLGVGVERALAVFQYSESEKRERDFLLNVGNAVWAEAVDVATDAGMRKVTGRTGLFWPDVLAAMATDDWRAAIEANTDSLLESGLWGVPTMRIGDFVAWGQDRDWLLVRHLEELCDKGDGILV